MCFRALNVVDHTDFHVYAITDVRHMLTHKAGGSRGPVGSLDTTLRTNRRLSARMLYQPS